MSEEQEHGPRLDEIDEEGTIRIQSEELRRILNENARLNDQVRELHAANTALIEENRTAREFERRVGVVLQDRAAALGMWRGMKAADVMIGEVFDALEREIVRVNSTDRSTMVREFLERVTPWQERRESPELPSSSTLRFRVRLVLDEVVELLDAIYDDRAAIDQLRGVFSWFLDVSPWRRDLFLSGDVFAGVVHEAVDVAYTIEGMLATLGVDGTAIFRLVDAANKAKAGGGRDDSGKLKKPAGWTPPDVAGELRRQSLAAGRKGPEDEGSGAGRVEGRNNSKSAEKAPPCERCGSLNTGPLPSDVEDMLGRRFGCEDCRLAFVRSDDGGGASEVSTDDDAINGDPRDAW